MKYVAKDITENVNVSKGHPLRDFLKLLTLVGFIVVTLYTLLGIVSDQLIKDITYKQEVELFSFYTQLKEKKAHHTHQKIKTLVKNLWSTYPESKDAPLYVDIIPSKKPNAFMAIGGRLSLTQGILDTLKNENEVSFVICHEIGHFYHRHVIKSVGREILTLFLKSLSGIGNSAHPFINHTSKLSQLTFSRSQETQADIFAVNCMNKYYGHVNGYDSFFKWTSEQKNSTMMDNKFMSYISTHPYSKDRIKTLQRYIGKKKYQTTGAMSLHNLSSKSN